jgi:hypothetical protein
VVRSLAGNGAVRSGVTGNGDDGGQPFQQDGYGRMTLRVSSADVPLARSIEHLFLLVKRFERRNLHSVLPGRAGGMVPAATVVYFAEYG